MGAIAWSVPTMAGLALGQFGGAISDVVASIAEGELCFEASKSMLKSHKPVLTTLFKMGCIVPIDDFENPIYFSQSELFNKKSSIDLFECH